MKLEKFAAMIPENGPNMLERLRRMQPPAGNVYDDEILNLRSRSAAEWLRGYAHALYDLGKLTDRQTTSIHKQICELEPSV
ncbi:MAG TPA: hypothetical protein DD403_12530 [Pseudomonas sp.]|jgi:hypothetical protein|nr:hypothetical protein [Pseudomonas sp.]|tara:strand:+ start:1035 stop:1277 length:243 start_codon:yes stop_codon:yes gene_type:complete